jgi:putative colanic acid biosynthesis glycosyltransferase
VEATTPTVSIIVAVRNAASSVARTLESARDQTYQHKDIVVVDGKSTDETLAVVGRYSQHVSTLLSEPDSGIADAYNKGIRLAKGEWIYFLNADDVFESNAVLADIFSQGIDDRYDVVVGQVLADNGRVFDGRYTAGLLIRNTVHHQAIFYRASLLKQRPYNAQYRRYGHDHEHNLALWKAGVNALYLRKTIALWATGGISDNAKWKDYREEFRVRRNVMGWAGWPCNAFTVARFLLKRARSSL